jgi:hypothetical protein
MAMGAILGIAAFGRTQEKLAGANNGGIQAPATGSSSGFTAPSAPASGFSAASGSFSSTAPTTYTPPASWGSTPIATASGKKVVPDEPQPSI